MQTLHEIRAMLDERGLAPRHALGQNFLLDHNLIRRLVDASGVGEGDAVLEVGPGTGTLTEELLGRGCRVVAVEKDRGLAELLRERLAEAISGGRFTLIEGDCLAGKHAVNAAAIAALGEGPFVLVANLPYGAATPLMLSLMADHPSCRGQFVTVQREVVDRLIAEPGSKAYGSISVVAARVCERERLGTLPPECFWPRPKVTSGMVALRRRAEGGAADARGLAEFCKVVFGGRRKQLGTVLKRAGLTPEPWPEWLDPTVRIEALTPEQIESLQLRCAVD